MAGSKVPARMGMPVPDVTRARARGAAAHGAGHHPLQRAGQPGRDRPPDHLLAAQPAKRRPIRAARQRRQPGQEVSWRGLLRPGRAARARVCQCVWLSCCTPCQAMHRCMQLHEPEAGIFLCWSKVMVHGAVSAWTAPGGRSFSLCLLAALLKSVLWFGESW